MAVGLRRSIVGCLWRPSGRDKLPTYEGAEGRGSWDGDRALALGMAQRLMESADPLGTILILETESSAYCSSNATPYS